MFKAIFAILILFISASGYAAPSCWIMLTDYKRVIDSRDFPPFAVVENKSQNGHEVLQTRLHYVWDFTIEIVMGSDGTPMIQSEGVRDCRYLGRNCQARIFSIADYAVVFRSEWTDPDSGTDTYVIGCSGKLDKPLARKMLP